jgi:hypothetical protein
MVRKITIVVMAITYLFGCGIPIFMNVWNVDKMVFGVPCFFFGLWVVSGLLVLESLFLFLYEKNKDIY